MTLRAHEMLEAARSCFDLIKLWMLQGMRVGQF
jgi:hypothetical protein